MPSQPERSMNELATLSQATTMLAEARTLPEVRSIMDIAEAARVYARAAKLGLESANYAMEIKLRAERKAGELLAQLERGTGGQPYHSTHSRLERVESEYRATLDAENIATTTAHRWQKVAAIAEPDFEAHLDAVKSNGEELTTANLLRSSNLPHVANNSGNNEWYTPSEFLSAAREVMGDIDLDPASSAEANTIVCATMRITAG